MTLQVKKVNVITETWDVNPSPTDVVTIGNTGNLESSPVSSIVAQAYTSTDVAYVDVSGDDTTGELGKQALPFLTVEAACDALPSTGGTIKIGVGTFFSPPKAKIKSNTKFIGEGKPITDSVYTYTAIGVQPTITSPTKLVGGTILLGWFDGSLKDGIELHNLGVDAGLEYCNTYNGGAGSDAIFFAQYYDLAGGLPSQDGLHQLQTNSAPRRGIVINNVSALCKAAATPAHAMLVENTLNAKITNVSTYFGLHGLVIKSIGATLVGHDGHGHGENSLILKTNDYAYGEGITVSDVYATSIVGYDGGGINLVGENGLALTNFSISNFVTEYVKYSVRNQGLCTGFTISNGVAYKSQNNAIEFTEDASYYSVSNIEQDYGAVGFAIVDNSANDNVVNVSNVTCRNNTAFGAYLSATGNAKIFVSNINTLDNATEEFIAGNVYGNLNEYAAFLGTVSGQDGVISNEFTSLGQLIAKDAARKDATEVYVQERANEDLTMSTYTSETLDSAYPLALGGDRVICPNINLIYTKTSLGWLKVSTTIA